MRKIYKTNNSIDIYIDLERTSYYDYETQVWLWENARVQYSGLNTTPIRFDGSNFILGWEDDGHICFDNNCLKLDPVYFQILSRDIFAILTKLKINTIMEELHAHKL